MTELFSLSLLKSRLQQYALLKSRGDLPVASVAVIINSNIGGGAILLIKRTERSNDPWSGQISFPGGHKSPEDKGLLQIAIRETQEEVGISLGNHELLGSLPLVTTRSRRIQVASFVFELRGQFQIRTNQEVEESFWLPLNELARLKATSRSVQAEGGVLEVDSFEYGGRVVWGLTFRILNLLLGKNGEAGQ